MPTPYTGKPKMSPKKMETTVVPPVDDMEDQDEMEISDSPLEKIKSMCSALSEEERMELCSFLQESEEEAEAEEPIDNTEEESQEDAGATEAE